MLDRLQEEDKLSSVDGISCRTSHVASLPSDLSDVLQLPSCGDRSKVSLQRGDVGRAGRLVRLRRGGSGSSLDHGFPRRLARDRVRLLQLEPVEVQRSDRGLVCFVDVVAATFGLVRFGRPEGAYYFRLPFSIALRQRLLGCRGLNFAVSIGQPEAPRSGATAALRMLLVANVITVSVPDGSTGQVWWSVNLGDNTKARIYNGTQLAFRRNIGIPEYSNQPPQTLQGYRELPTT